MAIPWFCINTTRKQMESCNVAILRFMLSIKGCAHTDEIGAIPGLALPSICSSWKTMKRIIWQCVQFRSIGHWNAYVNLSFAEVLLCIPYSMSIRPCLFHPRGAAHGTVVQYSQFNSKFTILVSFSRICRSSPFQPCQFSDPHEYGICTNKAVMQS